MLIEHTDRRNYSRSEPYDGPERRRAFIKVLDDQDPNSLTNSDIAELKWLAKQSRSVKWFIAGIIAIIAFTGLDHIRELIAAFRHP